MHNINPYIKLKAVTFLHRFFLYQFCWKRKIIVSFVSVKMSVIKVGSLYFKSMFPNMLEVTDTVLFRFGLSFQYHLTFDWRNDLWFSNFTSMHLTQLIIKSAFHQQKHNSLENYQWVDSNRTFDVERDIARRCSHPLYLNMASIKLIS
jgi:hypothetical protein